MKCAYQIRAAERSDVYSLLELMKELAAFERYLDKFSIDADALLRCGFSEPTQFTAYVATTDANLIVGYALTYLIPFTYDLRPTRVLKELYIRSEHRGRRVGGLLFAHVRAEARRQGCGWLKWTVLPDNERAKTFYRTQGGASDRAWEHWCLQVGT